MQLKCDEKNNPSIRVASRCGYTLEGMLREDSYNEYFDDLRNTMIFSKLESDYLKDRIF